MKIGYSLVGLMGVLALAMVLFAVPDGDIFAQSGVPAATDTPLASVPQIPMVVTGLAVGAPDGFKVVAKITKGGFVYETPPVEVVGESYLIKVAPPDSRFIGEEIAFYLEGAEANQRLQHAPGVNEFNFELTFNEIPVATLTPTPVPVLPSTYSGTIVVAGQTVSENMLLVARVGPYQSPPAAILSNGQFINLVILTDDEELIGLPVEFFLNGRPSTPPASGVFEPGSRNELNLVFESIPDTPTPIPTDTPIPPTATPEPTATPVPTDTPVPPTATPEPTATPVPTNTPVPPTATPEPTATPVPPTATRVPPTATSVPVLTTAAEDAEVSEDEGGGLCSSTAQLPLEESAANLMLLFAPLVMLGGVKYVRGRRRRE